MRKRLCAAIALGVLGIVCLGRLSIRVQPVQAAANAFRITALDCTDSPGHITITNITGLTQTLDNLTVTIGAQSFSINNAINPGGFPYQVAPGASIDLQVGPGALQVPSPALPPTAPNSIALSSGFLLRPNTAVSLFTAPGGLLLSAFSCPVGQMVFTVSTFGFDILPSGNPNSVCGPDLASGTAPTDALPGPCLTIQNALTWSRDGDIILVEAGIYEVCAPINVSKLVRITTLQNAATGGDINAVPGAGTSGSSPIVRNRVILHSFSGASIFHVTAVGYPSVSSPSNIPNTVGANLQANTLSNTNFHVLIDGFIMGGAFNPGAAAIFLDTDANTDVRSNILGGDPLSNPHFTGIPCSQPPVFPPAMPVDFGTKIETFGNANSIILQNSDHPNVFQNALLGSSIFQFAPVLIPGQVQTGFGIITSECLGLGPDASDAATVAFNLIVRNTNAGIWLCSDGGGGHLISTNTVRNNGRGIVLRAIADTLLDGNTVSDDFQDGVVIYDASSNNTLQRNLIESNSTPGAAGIRLGGFGAPIFPLQTAVNSNTLRRNWIGLVIGGARNTTGIGNIITAEVARTAILLQVGSVGAPAFTEPDGTAFNQNEILANGGCGAQSGCAIRLDQFVTSSVDATQNNFGLPISANPNSVLWHKPNDPTLGFISANLSSVQPVQATPVPAIGAPGAVGNGVIGSNFPATSPLPVPPGVPVPGASATPAAGAPGVAPLPSTSGTPASGGTPIAGATPPAGAATPTAGTPVPIPSGSLVPSPALSSGPAGGSTVYSPPCSLISVPSSVGASVSAATFLSLFQPVTNLYSAWRYDNARHTFSAIYFSTAGAPVDGTTLRPGDTVAICVTDNLQGPP